MSKPILPVPADPLAEIARMLRIDRRVANLGRRAGSRRDAEADALAEGIASGDLDADSEPIPYFEPRQ